MKLSIALLVLFFFGCQGDPLATPTREENIACSLALDCAKVCRHPKCVELCVNGNAAAKKAIDDYQTCTLTFCNTAFWSQDPWTDCRKHCEGVGQCSHTCWEAVACMTTCESSWCADSCESSVLSEDKKTLKDFTLCEESVCGRQLWSLTTEPGDCFWKFCGEERNTCKTKK